MTVHIGDLRVRAERAQRTFEEGRAALYRPDGGQRFSDAEHAERLGALRSERNRILREVQQEAEAEITSAQEDLAALENGDPTMLLTTEELERANARRALVLDDVADLTHEELVNRLKAVLYGGDPASMFVYLQAGRRRVREMGASRVPPELSMVLEELAEKLIPDSRKRELEAARTRIQEAGEAKDDAWLAERDQTTAYNPPYAVPGPRR